MEEFIVVLIFIGLFVGSVLGLTELIKGGDRSRCETIARVTHQELRFIEPYWADWGCFAPQGDDWVDVESGRVIP